jgi:single-stranded DNA-binding protein
VTKGTRVLVAGRAQVEHWSGDDGTERVDKRIVCD